MKTSPRPQHQHEAMLRNDAQEAPARRADQSERSRGQALAEFALLLPVLLLLMFMAVDFGRLFFSYIAINNAAREATYYAAAHAADDDFDLATYEAAVAEAGEQRRTYKPRGAREHSTWASRSAQRQAERF